MKHIALKVFAAFILSLFLVAVIAISCKAQNIYTDPAGNRIAAIETKKFGYDSATCLKIDMSNYEDGVVKFSWFLMDCRAGYNVVMASGSLRLPVDPDTQKDIEEAYLFNLMANNFLSVKFK